MLQGKTRLTGGRCRDGKSDHMEQKMAAALDLAGTLGAKRHGAATGTDHASGGWRSPRSEGEAKRRRDRARESEGMPYALETIRHRQSRRYGHKRGRDQEDRRADRAVALVAVLRRRILRRVGGDGDPMGRAKRKVLADHGAIEIDVAERDNDLQQKRRKREICATSFMTLTPSHAPMLTLQYHIWQEDLFGGASAHRVADFLQHDQSQLWPLLSARSSIGAASISTKATTAGAVVRLLQA